MADMRPPPSGSVRSSRYRVLSVLHTIWTWVMMGHEETVCHSPKGHLLLLGGTEPSSSFLKTQPAPSPPSSQSLQGLHSSPVLPFFRGNHFEGPVPLFSTVLIYTNGLENALPSLCASSPPPGALGSPILALFSSSQRSSSPALNIIP